MNKDNPAPTDRPYIVAVPKKLITVCQSLCLKGMMGAKDAMPPRWLEFLLALLHSVDDIF